MGRLILVRITTYTVYLIVVNHAISTFVYILHVVNHAISTEIFHENPPLQRRKNKIPPWLGVWVVCPHCYYFPGSCSLLLQQTLVLACL